MCVSVWVCECVCVFYLFICNKKPKTQWLREQLLYHILWFCGSGVLADFGWVILLFPVGLTGSIWLALSGGSKIVSLMLGVFTIVVPLNASPSPDSQRVFTWSLQKVIAILTWWLRTPRAKVPRDKKWKLPVLGVRKLAQCHFCCILCVTAARESAQVYREECQIICSPL